MEENNAPQKQNTQNLIASSLKALQSRYVVVAAE